jgi:hypothetical protein
MCSWWISRLASCLTQKHESQNVLFHLSCHYYLLNTQTAQARSHHCTICDVISHANRVIVGQGRCATALLSIDELPQSLCEGASLLVGFALSLSTRSLAVDQFTCFHEYDLKVASHTWVLDQAHADVRIELLLKNGLE